MTRSISILHVAQPVIGGVARVVVNAASDQARRGWRVTVASPDGGELAPSLPADVRHVRWRADRAPGRALPREVSTLRRVVRTVEPDVIHLHSSKAMFAGRLAVRGAIPTIVQPHAWSFWALGGRAAHAATLWERFAARWCDAIVCVSQGELTAGVEAGVRGPFTVVPNGVDVDAYTADGSATRERLALGSRPVAAFVGRLERQKGADVLLRAWPRILADVGDAHLLVVGDGADRTRLAGLGVPDVTFAGAQPNVREWLAAADVAVFPSRWEAGSLAVLEAMAVGRSVVVTDVAGTREAVRPGTGSIVPREDADALAAAVTRRLTDRDLARSEGAAARSLVLEHYTLAQQLDRLASLTHDVVSSR